MFLWEMSEKYGIGGEVLIFSKIVMAEHGKITFSPNSIFLGGKTPGVRPILYGRLQGE